MAVSKNVAVQDVSVRELQAELLKANQRIHVSTEHS